MEDEVQPNNPFLSDVTATRLTGALGSLLMLASSFAGVNMISNQKCAEGVGALSVGLLGVMLMLGGLMPVVASEGLPITANISLMSVVAQVAAVLIVAISLIRILVITRSCKGFTPGSGSCGTPTKEMKSGIAEYVVGILFLTALYQGSQSATIVNAIVENVRSVFKRGEGEEQGDAGDADDDGFQFGGAEEGEEGGSSRFGFVSKLIPPSRTGKALLFAFLLFLSMAIGFGVKHARAGWITSTVFTVIIFVAMILMRFLSAERQEALAGMAAGLIPGEKSGQRVRAVLMGLRTVMPTIGATFIALAGIGFSLSGSSKFNSGCKKQTAD